MGPAHRVVVFGGLFLFVGLCRLWDVLRGKDESVIEGTIWATVGIVLGLGMWGILAYWMTRPWK
jgi:hypothetical protein